MKSAYFKPKKNSFLCGTIIIVAFSVFISCKKDIPGGGPVAKGEAKIKFINASQSSSSIDFYLDDAKINSSALAYGEASEYIKIASGTKVTKVNQGVSTLETISDFNFTPTLSYTSFFVEDKLGKGEILTLEDNLGAVDADKSRVRFVNLSPNFTNTINVSLTGGELVVNALSFKASSSYFMIQAGTSFTVAVVGAGASKITADGEFEGGKNYTIWLSGTSNSNLTVNKITYN